MTACYHTAATNATTIYNLMSTGSLFSVFRFVVIISRIKRRQFFRSSGSVSISWVRPAIVSTSPRLFPSRPRGAPYGVAAPPLGS